VKFRYISFQLELIVSSIGDSCDILHFMVTWVGIAPICMKMSIVGLWVLSIIYLWDFVHDEGFCCGNL